MDIKPNKIILVPAILTRANPMKDGGMSLGFQTNEMDHEEKVILMEKLQAFGWLAFRENEIDVLDMPKEEAEEGDRKPSVRLKNTLFVLSQQEGIPKEEFNKYYREKMEALITWVKKKLEPEK